MAVGNSGFGRGRCPARERGHVKPLVASGMRIPYEVPTTLPVPHTNSAPCMAHTFPDSHCHVQYIDNLGAHHPAYSPREWERAGAVRPLGWRPGPELGILRTSTSAAGWAASE